MKWLIGLAIAAAAVVGAVAAETKSAHPAYSAEYCAARLNDLKMYRSGETPPKAPDTSMTTDAIVGQCAANDSSYAKMALPYLSKEEAAYRGLN